MADLQLGSKYVSLLEMNALVEKDSSLQITYLKLQILHCANLFPLLIMLYIMLSVLYIIVTAILIIPWLINEKWCSD